MDESAPADESKAKGGWRQNLLIIIGTLGYMVPLFWLWSETEFPQGFGIHITAHGKGGLLEHWWYSYLLVQRAQPWDIVLFLYMWAPVAGFIGWLIWKWWNGREHKRLNLSLFDDAPPFDPPPNQ